MKKNTSLIFLSICAIAVLGFTGAVTAFPRIFVAKPEAENDIQVNMVWLSNDTRHVAMEYDVVGTIKTPNGDYSDCPIGKTVITDDQGNDITGEVYTSCRFVFPGKYEVTQFFYNDFSNRTPKTATVNIGDVVFFSSEDNQEVHIPVLQSVAFDIPKEPDTEISSYPEATDKAVSGIDLSIQRADFTPRVVKVDACLTLPDNGDWGVKAFLQMGDQTLPIDYWDIPNFRDPQTLQSEHRCFTFLFTTEVPDFRNVKAGAISLRVENVYKNLPDCVTAADLEKLQAKLHDYGITPKPGKDGSYCFASDISSLSNAKDSADLSNFIAEALKEEVPGPLTIVLR